MTDGIDIYEWMLNSGTVKKRSGIPFSISSSWQDFITDVYLLPNNKLLLFAGQGRHRIIDGTTSTLLRLFAPVVYLEDLVHMDRVNVISQLSPDKSRLITISYSGYLREYDVGSGVLLQEIDLFPEIYHDTMPLQYDNRFDYRVTTGEIDHSGRRMMLKLVNGDVIFVTLDSLQAIMEEARRHLRGRKLTPDEMVKYNLR